MADDLAADGETFLETLAQVLRAVGPTLPQVALKGDIVAPSAAHALPVLDTLDAIHRQAPPACRTLAAQLCALAPRLAWRQTYRPGEVEDAFLRGYGWTELVGVQGLVRDPSISAGLLLLGPHVRYPPHRHPALEHYVPLSGVADWYDEDRGWRPEPPLATIVHRSGISHAMRTGEQPLLAYYQWTGPGVDVSARLSDVTA